MISTRLFVECKSKEISFEFMYDKPLPHKMIDALVQPIYIDYCLVPDFTIGEQQDINAANLPAMSAPNH